MTKEKSLVHLSSNLIRKISLKTPYNVLFILTLLSHHVPVKSQLLERPPPLLAVNKIDDGGGGGDVEFEFDDPIINHWLHSTGSSSNGRSSFDIFGENLEEAENWIPSTVKMGRGIDSKNGKDDDTNADLPDSGTPSQKEQEKIKFVAEWNQMTVDYEFLIELTAEYYCERFGALHVLCAYQHDRRGVIYYERGVSEMKVEFILAYLIRLRKRLLLGKEDGPYPGGTMQPLPKARRICVLVWSEELQVVAQKIANQVVRTLNQSLIYATDKFPKLTVTIAMSQDTQDRPRWTHALDYWHKQVTQVPQDVIFESDGGYRDYAAMVWGSSFQVGCGFMSGGTKKYVGKRIKVYVCAFGPGGNVPGKKIYVTEKEEEPVHPTTTERPDEKDVVTKKPLELVNPLGELPDPQWIGEEPIPKHLKPGGSTTTARPEIITQRPLRPTTTTTAGTEVSESEETTKKSKTEKPSKITTAKIKPPKSTPKVRPLPPKSKSTRKPQSPKSTQKPKPPPTKGTVKPKTPKSTSRPQPPKSTSGPQTPKSTTARAPPSPPKFEPDIIIFDNKTRKYVLQNPFMVLIFYGELKGDGSSSTAMMESHICSGTIYNGEWILTSYYCALPTLRRQRGEPTHKVATVFYGELILKIGIPDEDFRFVTQAVVPPELDTGKMGLFDHLDVDIALLKLNKKISHSKYTKAIKLAFDPILYEGGEFSQFVGWTIEREDDKITAYMRKMKLTMHSNSQSTKIFSTSFNTEVRFSAKVTRESKNGITYNADNGGALVKIVLTDNHQAPVPTAEIYILGILPVSSCQRREAKVDMVGVEYYTKVFKWIQWIGSVGGEQGM